MTTGLTATRASATPCNWGLLGTLLWGAGIASAFVALQTAVMAVYLSSAYGKLTRAQLVKLFEVSHHDGVGLSLATVAGALLCVPLIVGAVKLKRGSRVAHYLAANPVPARTLGVWLAWTVAFIVVSDSLTLLLERPAVPGFMESAYASANPVWLIWLALVVGAPLFEEAFFRGFLFKGLETSFGPAGAIAVTAALWAAAHMQYDAYEIGTVFFAGLAMGLARVRTNSILTPFAMHSLMNAVACAEAAILARSPIA